jgi:hypothetical protein
MVVVGFGLNTATLPRGLTNRHLYFNDSGDTSWASEWQLKLLPRDTHHAPEFLRDLLKGPHGELVFPTARVDGQNWLLTTWDLHATPVELQDSVLKTVELLLRVISEPQSPQSNDSTD